MNTSRLRHILLSFTTGQGALQAIQIVSGFVLVRHMDVHEYGVVAFLLAMQGAASVLSDIALRNGVVATLGSDSGNRDALGKLIRAAFYQRTIHVVLVSIGIIAAFWVFHVRQGLPLSKAMTLAATVILTVYFNSWALYFSLPWVLNHDMTTYYRPQIIFQAARLIIIFGLIASGTLDALTVAIVSVLAIAGTGLWYREKSKPLVELPPKADPADIKQLRKYILPLAPSEMFWAVQDQIPVFLLTITGGTINLAHVFALGRLGIAFQFFATATYILAMPWLARTSREALPKRYAIVFGLAALLAGGVVLGSVVVPDVYLWFLGDQYRHLYTELRLAIGGASALFLYGVLYQLNNSRMWIWPWTGVAYVVVVLGTQVACILLLDMSQTRNVLFMTLLVGVGAMSLQLLYTVLGFAFRNRPVPEPEKKVQAA